MMKEINLEETWDSIERIDDYEATEASMKQIKEAYEESREEDQ